MTPDDQFYLLVGIVAVAAILAVAVFYALNKFFDIDVRVEFYAAQAELIADWYERKERREAAANRRRSSERHPAKRKN